MRTPMPSFPRCEKHGLRLCPCGHPGQRYSSDIQRLNEVIREKRAEYAALVAFRNEVKKWKLKRR